MAGDSTAVIAVLARPEVQAALARGDWSVVLRAFLDAGLSQTTIAARTGISQSQVSRLASGQSSSPGIKTVKALCDGLAVPRQLAGLADELGQEDDTHRRQFLGGSLGVLAAAVMPHSDLGDERLLMATSLSYRQLEQRTPARSLAQPVASHLSLAYDLARRAEGKQRARLSAAVAEIAGLAAWLHADLAEPAQARRFYKMSITAAQQAQHGLLAIYMQGSFGQYATTVGDSIHGLRLLRDANARLPRSAPPTARAWLAALEAVALGYLGDRAALKVIDDAQRYADASASTDPVWPWVFQFDTSKIASYRAVATSRLGLTKIAIEAFGQAEEATRSPKQAAIVATEQARALAASGHLDQAYAHALAAYEVGCSYDSERVRQAVRDFRSGPGTRHRIG
ncbi:MAG TPA: helix-turn-helix transcriptional regulator [Streptosporangiaceae bacterium]|nr:helix-turn-helix transcriptional regulator [Streptosporangiaceae bacterium]